MRIERQVWGSFKGYTTLGKSPGVSADDSRILETAAYSYGQTYDARFSKSLAKTPAYFTRALRGGRRALTRVMEGSPDDNNRPTLRMVTAIISQHDWDGQLHGDLQLLLGDERLWQWDGNAQIAPVEMMFPPPSVSVPRRSVPRLLALLSEIERGFTGRRGFVVSANEFSLQEIACLEMLVPPSARAEFSTAYRTLSPQLPAVVNCLAAEAGGQDRVTYKGQTDQAPLSPYAERLSLSEFSTGSIPLDIVMTYNRFGMPAPQSQVPLSLPMVAAVSPPSVTVVQRGKTWPLLAVVLASVVLAVGAFVGAMLLSQSKVEDLQRQLSEVLSKNESIGAELRDFESRQKTAQPTSMPTATTGVGNSVSNTGNEKSAPGKSMTEEMVRAVVKEEMKKAPPTTTPLPVAPPSTGQFATLDEVKKLQIDIDSIRLVKSKQCVNLCKKVDALDTKTDALSNQRRYLEWLENEFDGIVLVDPSTAIKVITSKKRVTDLLLIIKTNDVIKRWLTKVNSAATAEQRTAEAKLIRLEGVEDANEVFKRLKPEDFNQKDHIKQTQANLEGILKFVNENDTSQTTTSKPVTKS